MLNIFSGTDRAKARSALNAAVGDTPVVRISDASSMDDFRSALQGVGIFGSARAVVFDGISANEEMFDALVKHLTPLAGSDEQFFVYEEKLDAATGRTFEKYAKAQIFDLPKSVKARPTVFQLADHMKKGGKNMRKNMWVAYQRELAQGEAPEAIHGVLFWGAKQTLLSARDVQNVQRSKRLIATLAELPHESRRRGEELEYALERFILSIA